MDELKYPIGKFAYDVDVPVAKWVQIIHEFPNQLNDVLKSSNEEQLDNQYRPDGWTGRQVVHHVADSHSHALIRFKWSLTENRPVIKPYLENEYAKLADYSLPVESALLILSGVHLKWHYIMSKMEKIDWERGYDHPQSNKFFSLNEAAALYAWHCMHHLGHIKICCSK
ncbi:MAG: putative metal-dependent hydrolase [Saprospiraceae bacterium]|nr:putative metal-dependent hydrolase [Saprospiraceae bacterium]